MATAAVTYVFANGTNADGVQVNSNFNSVVNFLNTETVQRDASVAFTAIPSLPAVDPTTDNQAVRKAYVDNFLPAGVITQYGAASAPTGWVLCQGQALSRTNPLYSRLFTAISTTYGAGDGTTTYNVPNLQGRIPVGRDSTQTEFDVLAETGGSKITTLITDNLPSHQHGVGTIVPDTIADHVHAHTLAIANHSSSHTHAVDPPSTAVSVTVNDNTVDRVTRLTAQVAGGFATGIQPAVMNGLLAGTAGFGYSNTTEGMAVAHENEHAHTASGTVDIASFTSGSESGFAAMVHSFTGSITAGGGHTHTMSGSTAFEGSGTSFSNLAPYIVVNYIIKL